MTLTEYARDRARVNKSEPEIEPEGARESKSERGSRVSQPTCIWMSGASGLGNLTRYKQKEPMRIILAQELQ